MSTNLEWDEHIADQDQTARGNSLNLNTTLTHQLFHSVFLHFLLLLGSTCRKPCCTSFCSIDWYLDSLAPFRRKLII